MGLQTFGGWKRQSLEDAKAGIEEIMTNQGPVRFLDSKSDGLPVFATNHAAAHIGHMFNAVEPDGCRYITVGHWGSPGMPFENGDTLEKQADTIVSLMDALEIEKAPVMGCSSGGLIAVLAAIRHPFRITGLISLCGITGQWDQAKSFGAIINRAMLSDFSQYLVYIYAQMFGYDALLKSFAKSGGAEPEFIVKDPLAREVMIKTLKVVNPASAYRKLLDQSLYAPRELDRLPVEKIKAPTLVIHSHDDAMVPYSHAEFLATNIPDCKLLPVDKGGHFHLIHEKRDDIRSAISEFVLNDVYS